MEMQRGTRLLSGVLLLGLPLLVSSAYAATAIDLSNQNTSILKSFTPSALTRASNNVGLQEVNRNVDFKQTLHVRVNETYAGYPVFGGEAIMHIPHGDRTLSSVNSAITAATSNKASSMTGTLYQNISTDLQGTPNYVFTEAQANKALAATIASYQQSIGEKVTVTKQQSKLMVYIDEAGKAHWAYKVSFYVPASAKKIEPAAPVYIIDAVTMQVYTQWNDVKTLENVTMDVTDGGGFGGNKKMGELDYDGMPQDLAKLSVERDATAKKCYLENNDVTVENYSNGKVATFNCTSTNDQHNNVYWDGDADAVNGGYSPQNDALFAGQVIKGMYQDWYHVPVLKQADGSPMMLTMVVHVPKYDNAYWDPTTATMTFGDGYTDFYPLTSLGVGAHEISHGFTSQHSDLVYKGQSGGMNEAFSDMAAQAAEYYAYGKNSWQIGPEIFKAENEALRYMDKPSKDGMSIDDASQYKSSLDVHYSSGVYNRLFYLMGSAEGSNAHKAFDVMVQAQNYWTSNATFETGACGVLKAAKDVGFDLDVVKSALKTVKINTSKCPTDTPPPANA